MRAAYTKPLVRARVMLFLALLTPAASWAEWTKFGDSGTDAYYIDRSAFEASGGFRRAWILLDMKAPDETGAKSVKLLEEFDCKGRRYRVLQSHLFEGNMGQGKQLQMDLTPAAWMFVPPESVSQALLRTACVR